MNKHRKTPIKLDELKVRGGELLFEQLSLRANTTLNATMILFLSFLSLISNPFFLGGLLHYIVSFYTILIVHMFIIQASTWVYVLLAIFFGSPWMMVVKTTFVQMSSPYKCGQRSCCSAFNAVAAAFAPRYFCILIIFACAWSSFLSLDLPGGSSKLPKYLLDWYSLYPRSINSSNYIPSSFLYVIPHSEPLLIIYSSSDVSMSLNKAQGSIYHFGILPR